MIRCEPSICARNVYLALLATLALPAVGNADEIMLNLVYAEDPESAVIRAGDRNAAIEHFERKVEAADEHYVVDELATLCALYIAKGSLSAASVTCQAAVDTDRSAAAYNNRGVFRAQLGDAKGAMEDFVSARNTPARQVRDIEEFVGGDPRQTASVNFVRTTRLIAEKYGLNEADRNGQDEHIVVSSARGASVEDLDKQ